MPLSPTVHWPEQMVFKYAKACLLTIYNMCAVEITDICFIENFWQNKHDSIQNVRDFFDVNFFPYILHLHLKL